MSININHVLSSLDYEHDNNLLLCWSNYIYCPTSIAGNFVGTVCCKCIVIVSSVYRFAFEFSPCALIRHCVCFFYWWIDLSIVFGSYFKQCVKCISWRTYLQFFAGLDLSFIPLDQVYQFLVRLMRRVFMLYKWFMRSMLS